MRDEPSYWIVVLRPGRGGSEQWEVGSAYPTEEMAYRVIENLENTGLNATIWPSYSQNKSDVLYEYLHSLMGGSKIQYPV